MLGKIFNIIKDAKSMEDVERRRESKLIRKNGRSEVQL